jgi:hypothetical protein
LIFKKWESDFKSHSCLGIYHKFSQKIIEVNVGAEAGGRDGSNAHPHLPKISPTLGIVFSKVLVAHPKKTPQGTNIFQEDRGSWVTPHSAIFSLIF